jgi:hypothetical protein
MALMEHLLLCQRLRKLPQNKDVVAACMMWAGKEPLNMTMVFTKGTVGEGYSQHVMGV